jgi:hypothetical protein
MAVVLAEGLVIIGNGSGGGRGAWWRMAENTKKTNGDGGVIVIVVALVVTMATGVGIHSSSDGDVGDGAQNDRKQREFAY